MKTVQKWLKLGAVFCTATLMSTTSIAETKSQTWRIQTLWQPGTLTQQSFERFAENVKEKTDGEINIIALPAGAVVGVNETFDAVRRGILQGQHPAVVYWSGRDPAFAVLGDLNGAYDDPRDAEEYFYEHGGLELLREAYEPHGLFPIGVVWWGSESLPATRDIETPDALSGLKIRLPQGMSSDIFSKFGAVPVNLPGSEVFSALDSGTIDSTDWGVLSMNDELGFHDRAKFAIYPGIHSTPAGDVSISLKTWNSLSAETQALLEEAVREFAVDMRDTLEAADKEVAAKLAETDVTLIDWSPEDRLRFRNAAREVWEEYGKQNDLSRRAVETQIEFLQGKGLLD